jgi:nucleotide-binding universal stress UspA family protein
VLAAFESIVAADAPDAVALARLLAAPASEVKLVTNDGRDHAGALRAAVRARGADLLVVGTSHARLRRGDRPLVAPGVPVCAIAVAPYGFAGRGDRAIGTVGVGYVDDRAGRAVLDTARTLAWQLGAEVHATTVESPSNWDNAAGPMGHRAMLAARRMAEIPGVHGTALEGEPGRVLARLSKTVDLLIIGSHHHGVLRRVLLGEVAQRLARTARCPLVVLPPSD